MKRLKIGRLAAVSILAIAVLFAMSLAFALEAPSTATAQDQDVPILQTQVAAIEARVAVLETAVASLSISELSDATGKSTPITSSGELVIEGASDGLTESFVLDEGRYTLTLDCGSKDGYAEFLGQNPDEFLPTIFSERGSTVEEFGAGTYALQVSCYGEAWSLSIVPFIL